MPDESLDRVLESLCQINVNLEGLRVSLSVLSELNGDHETRIRKLEIWKHNLTPILAAITFILGAIFSAAIGNIYVS